MYISKRLLISKITSKSNVHSVSPLNFLENDSYGLYALVGCLDYYLQILNSFPFDYLAFAVRGKV